MREASLRLKSIVENDEKLEPSVSLIYSRLLSRQARFVYRLGSHHEARELLRESMRVLDQMEAGNPNVQEEKAV